MNALRTLGGNLKELKLEDDPVDVDDVDGITATSVIRDVHLIPGIWKIDGYTKLVRAHRGEVRRQARARTSSSSRTTGAATTASPRGSSRRRPEGWLDGLAAESSGNADAKLIVIGHSMGGLVARHFIECREGWRDTRTLVTIATPYGGVALRASGRSSTARRSSSST